MGLETGTYIDSLDPTWPTTGDPVSQGDDHLKILKSTIKNTLPNLSGAVTPTHTELNFVDGVTSAIQTQINAVQADVDSNEAAADLGICPIGGIIMYNGAFSAIPANWQICDGTGITPDLTDQFIYGTNTEGELLDSGGSADIGVITHTHPNAGSHQHGAAGGHSHTVALHTGNGSQANYASSTIPTSTDGSKTTSAVGNHQHAATGDHGHAAPAGAVSGTGANIPPYIKLAFIQRIT
ncbi:MAG: hypothetical protein DRJ15_17390 [Bacteroidetes bacterium]|nr:MAG: hypothetical protein DRJ15_17390 [Bacteroidota bacterium]